MKFLLALVTVTGMSFSLPSFASEEIFLTEADELAEVSDNDEFLGCVRRRRDCAHEASHHGYHHSRTLKDHHICPDHHVPFVCYGSN